MRVISAGEQPVDAFTVEVRVTQPDGISHTHLFKIRGAVSPSNYVQGNFHLVIIKFFSKTFALDKNPGKLINHLTCTVDAYPPKEIGGDRWTGPVTA